MFRRVVGIFVGFRMWELRGVFFLSWDWVDWIIWIILLCFGVEMSYRENKMLI